jgi:hypothetical protein
MYYVQCLAGHVREVEVGSDLEQRCKERAAKGFLDALCLTECECDQCREDRREELRREIRLCNEVGCPMSEDDCADGCLCAKELAALG